MVWDAVGVTGWGLNQVTALTMPQLWSLLKHRGRVLWPRVETMLDAQRAQGLHDDPKMVSAGEVTPVQRVLDSHERHKRNEPQPITAKDRRYDLAYRITYAKYLGDPDVQPERTRVVPFPGMGVAEARAILAWVASGTYTDLAFWQLMEDGRLDAIRAVLEEQ